MTLAKIAKIAKKKYGVMRSKLYGIPSDLGVLCDLGERICGVGLKPDLQP
jgi:hypothetical protein